MGIPVLVRSNNIFVREVCQYFLFLVIGEHLAVTSAKTYAERIALFFNFLEYEGLDFRDVRDEHLIRWENQQAKNGVAVDTQIDRCDAVFQLYVWLETRGYITNCVRVPGHNDHLAFTPALTSAPPKGSKRGKAVKHGIVSGVRPNSKGKKFQPTPTFDEVTELYVVADNGDAAFTERNHLLIDWYIQAGVRRHEFGSLTVTQIPNWEKIHELQQASEAYGFLLTVTKGRKPREVPVLPEILERTREYIEGPREEIIKRFKKKYGSDYIIPSEIFLSNKTGRPYNLTSLTNLIKSWFKSAGIAGTGHRLRATYLCALFDAEIEAELELVRKHPETKRNIDYEFVLLRVAERAGHSSPEQLRPYLTYVKKRRNHNGRDFAQLVMELDAAHQRIAYLERALSEKFKQLEESKNQLKLNAK
ncbi:tyrosine-type recombinase/integrase [Duganella sp. S19_KUP01_CR8]|uniref:tyrosine-type recombinase/integrase n=1 Tax=Duganella sp. S19_KUP01_CR8 TaxID=3025502 RepID=UPI002FCDB2A1